MMGGDDMKMYKTYVEGGTRIVKWLSENGLRSIDGVVTVVDPKNGQAIKVIEIDSTPIDFPSTSVKNDVVRKKDGKKIATWRLVNDDGSIKGCGRLITPLSGKT